MKAKLAFVAFSRFPIDLCGCHFCHLEWRRTVEAIDPDARELRFVPFIVCPDCGNKRCPRATYHDHECTRSNEPGQEGSVYGGFTLETPE
ncbi:hypothetical protein [Nocardia otitidiscaviarum]|uniref:hypothetical protein n=1 Tax=Nocardia otitidiscaviarum TaxID=1823 RepID=UPI002458DDD8|nr:hypothetical protein [Nocardia otitidiscaviarum]